MTTSRQFLVTLPDPPMSGRSDVQIANAIAYALATSGGAFGGIGVAPLPDLADDDSELQVAFRRLASLKTHPHVAEMVISREEALALVAELSKQHPARTSHVDQAALDAVRAIREADKQPGQQVQKNARAQLIITDAICRCVPEDRA